MEHKSILKSSPFFGAVLEDGHFEDIAGRCAVRRFGRSDVLMRQGEAGNSMLVIISGRVGVDIHEPSGKERVAVLGPGDVVGEMSLLTGAARTATVCAIEKTEALEVGKDSLEQLLAENPGLIIKFAQLLEDRDAQLQRLHQSAKRWNSVGLPRDEIAARMTAFFAG